MTASPDTILDERIKRIEGQIEALECDHTGHRLIRYRLASNGTKMFKVQCTRCGELIGDWIRHEDIKDKDAKGPIDDGLRDRYLESVSELKHALIEQKRLINRGSFFSWYDEYLSSDEWMKKREKVLERCNRVCEGCGENIATCVHHLTYKNVGNEFLFELVGLCGACHVRYHSQDDIRGAE
jgi:5-methylcytosine-specific restriction endonuclease McrA